MKNSNETSSKHDKNITNENEMDLGDPLEVIQQQTQKPATPNPVTPLSTTAWPSLPSRTNRATKGQPPVKRFTTFIKPVDSDEAGAEVTSEETKKSFMEVVNPKVDKIRVRSVRGLRDRSLAVDCAKQEDLNKIVSDEALAQKESTSSVPSRTRPQVIVYDVPREITGHSSNKRSAWHARRPKDHTITKKGSRAQFILG
ncbi:hypothetical protein QAD02_010480 [Eretmocerus hayati]|uniref:Uncharacterized protein n=1 Tax=Eretmocerus hayati TaxID=131215 RepID=A0ACC2NU07_9HYME|nr:hypothetical protein QAD02_010480 [Eretmocerus hayati]